ncbi:MAG: hypothetical protein GEU78_05345 [Actinobacteria bacterium]|nr:hypothetical protein [Actinomycetota bacterium]
MTDDLEEVRRRARDDRKLFERAAQVLAEIDRSHGLTDDQADVLAALRIRVEGKERTSLEDLLSVTGDIGAKRDLGEVLSGPEQTGPDWPDIEEKKREWPGL